MITAILRLLRVLGILFLLRLVLRSLVKPRPAKAPKSPAASDLVWDEVCNTHLLPERAIKVQIGGRDRFFCSEICRDRALARAS